MTRTSPRYRNGKSAEPRATAGRPLSPIGTYPGGKNGAGVYQAIINQIPPHRVFIEAFLGSGAILRRKRPAAVNIGIDVDPQVVDSFGGSQLGMAAAIGNLAERRRRSSADSLMPARDLRGKTADAASGIGDFTGGIPTSTLVICADASSFLSGYDFIGDEFVYCDPPYLQETRKQHKAIYRYEMMIRKTHARLLDVLVSLPCKVMVSGYRSELYCRQLDNWRTHTFQTATRGGSVATEWLWMNYPEPLELHDYQYFGSDFRERQDFKRMRQRWQAKLLSMPAIKRHALLSAIQGLDCSKCSERE